jgi:hypothetical protein
LITKSDWCGEIDSPQLSLQKPIEIGSPEGDSINDGDDTSDTVLGGIGANSGNCGNSSLSIYEDKCMHAGYLLLNLENA